MKLLFDELNIDMHVHSSYSEGRLLPYDIINCAKDNKIKIISITDHDTMKAYKDIDEKRLRKSGIKLIHGVEMSTLYKEHRIH